MPFFSLRILPPEAAAANVGQLGAGKNLQHHLSPGIQAAIPATISASHHLGTQLKPPPHPLIGTEGFNGVIWVGYAHRPHLVIPIRDFVNREPIMHAHRSGFTPTDKTPVWSGIFRRKVLDSHWKE